MKVVTKIRSKMGGEGAAEEVIDEVKMTNDFNEQVDLNQLLSPDCAIDSQADDLQMREH